MNSGLLEFETASGSHPGKARALNEDNYFAAPEQGVWLIADGMGGHSNGKLASSVVVETAKTVGRSASAPDLLARFKDRIYRANTELIRLSQQDGGKVIGSTVAALLVFAGHFACVWSGDSRVYLLRSGSITQISHDHSEVQEMIDGGLLDPAEARHWPRRNVVTQAVGVFEEPKLDSVQGKIEAGDIFVLCSDGLTGHVEDQEILELASGRPPREACEALIQLTLDRGAKDNVTVIVVACRPADENGPAVSPAVGVT